MQEGKLGSEVRRHKRNALCIKAFEVRENFRKQDIGQEFQRKYLLNSQAVVLTHSNSMSSSGMKCKWPGKLKLEM